VADTLTGLVVGHAVIIKRGVGVAVRVEVDVVDGHAVTIKRGVPVRVPVEVVEGVAVRVEVVEGVAVRVFVDVGGRAVGDTEAISLPTVKSTPHT